MGFELAGTWGPLRSGALVLRPTTRVGMRRAGEVTDRLIAPQAA